VLGIFVFLLACTIVLLISSVVYTTNEVEEGGRKGEEGVVLKYLIIDD
jgi:hypothetical protein